MPGKSSLSRALKQKLLDLQSVNLVSLGDAIADRSISLWVFKRGSF
jgi:hypothetical protein